MKIKHIQRIILHYKFDYVFSRRLEPAVCEIFAGTIKEAREMIEFFMGRAYHCGIVYERLTLRNERTGVSGGRGGGGGEGWESRSWHRLFTQAAS